MDHVAGNTDTPAAGNGDGERFRDIGLPDEERAEALLAQLTLDEKISMMHQWAPAVPRLGVAAFRTGTEMLHGAVLHDTDARATAFTQSIGIGATWNPALVERVGTAIAKEVHALRLVEPRLNLNVWGPVVNLLRDPRWGRNDEGFSEDPLHTAKLGIAFCRGLGNGDGRLLTAPTLKHFFAHNQEEFDTRGSQLRPRVLREYDLRVFEMIVRTGLARAVMPAHCAVNGRPNTLSQNLADLRRLSPDLVVVTDAFALTFMLQNYDYYDDRTRALAAAVHAGVDNFTDHDEDPTATLAAIRSALDQGLLDEDDITGAVRRLLRMRFALGEFDSPAEPTTPPSALQEISTKAHRELAREVSRQSVVLLKNEGGLLPLRDPERIAVIGPLADQAFRDWYTGEPPYDTTPLAGLRERYGEDRITFAEGVDRIALRVWPDGPYLGCGTEPKTPLRATSEHSSAERAFDLLDWAEGLCSLRSVANGRFLVGRDGTLSADEETVGEHWDIHETFRLVPADGATVLQHVATRTYATVAEDGTVVCAATEIEDATRFSVETLVDGAAAAVAAASDAEVAIVVVGAHARVPGTECFDRSDLVLSQSQEDLLHTVHAANPSTVAVLVSGFPLAVPRVAERLPALVWSAHAVQEFGNALADVLSGDYAPAGRVPQTWYRSVSDLGDKKDYDIIKSGKTYLYLRTEPLFPFGHGLTYTTFDYGPLRTSRPEAGVEDVVTFTVEIANIGDVDSDEVAQLYVQVPGVVVDRPLRQLLGFERVHIRAGERRTVAFEVAVADLSYWDVGAERFQIESGEHLFSVGASAADIRQTAKIIVHAEPVGPRSFSDGLVRAMNFDDYEGIALVDEMRRSRDAVEAVGSGSWLLYRDVALTEVSTFVARVRRVAPESGATIQVRLGDPARGHVVATVEIPDGDDGWAWSTVTAPASAPGGRHDIYLVFTGPARLSTFGMVSAAR